MNLVQYANRLHFERELLETRLAASDFWSQVAMPWFVEIAPVKAPEYGVDCIERMGPLGVMAEVSGCFYRFKRQTELGRSFYRDPMMRNAIIDAFGYAVILRIVVDGGGEDWDRHWHIVTTHKDPEWFNEEMLTRYWDGNAKMRPVGGFAAALAMGSAINQWRLAHERA